MHWPSFMIPRSNRPQTPPSMPTPVPPPPPDPRSERTPTPHSEREPTPVSSPPPDPCYGGASSFRSLAVGSAFDPVSAPQIEQVLQARRQKASRGRGGSHSQGIGCLRVLTTSFVLLSTRTDTRA